MALNRTFAGAAARTTLNGAITSGAPAAGATFTLTSGTGYPSTNFVVSVFILNADGSHAGEEKIFCSSRSGNVCTVGTAGRGFDGTTAADHANGSIVEHCLDAVWMTAVGAQVDLVSDVVTDRLLGRDTAGTGNPEQLTVSGGLEFTGSGGIQRSALTGDISASAGSGTTSIGADKVTTAKILDAAVTLAKQANLANATVIGRNTAGTGVPEAVTMAQLRTLLALASTNISDFNAAVDARIASAGTTATIVYKSADESVSSADTGTTLQNDNELLAALAVSTEYIFEAWLYIDSGAAADFKLAFTVPTGATLQWAGHASDNGATSSGLVIPTTTVSGTSQDVTTSSAAGLAARIWGSVKTDGTHSGNLTLQWAQRSSSASATTVKAGSWLRAQVGT